MDNADINIKSEGKAVPEPEAKAPIQEEIKENHPVSGDADEIAGKELLAKGASREKKSPVAAAIVKPKIKAPARFTKDRRIIIAACVLVFAAVVWLMMSGRLTGFDNAVQSAFFSLRTDWLTAILVPFSYSGNWPVPTAICLVLLIIPKTRLTYGVPMSASALTCVGVYQALKYTIRRARPALSLHLLNQDGYSFPSGHSLTSLVVWTVLIMLFSYYYRTAGESLPLYGKRPFVTTAYIRSDKKRRLASGLLIAYIVLMGLSRIYVGVHWPSDVLASWILGIALIEIADAVFF